MLPPCGPATPPIAQKRANLLSFGMSQPFVSNPVASVSHKLSFGPAVHMILPHNLKWLYRFAVFSLWFCVQQKLFQVSVKCLYDAPDQPAMLINGVWTWNKLHWLNVSPCKWNIVRTCWYPYHIFPISVCSVLRWFWDIYLVVDELSTYTKKATHWDKVLSSGNEV